MIAKLQLNIYRVGYLASCHRNTWIIDFTFKSFDHVALMFWHVPRQAQCVMLAFFGSPNVLTDSQVQIIYKKALVFPMN